MSVVGVADNRRKLMNLFPEAFRGDTPDFDKLREMLGYGEDLRHSGEDERETPVLFRACELDHIGRAESKNFHTTRNIYLEGDNLNALRFLRKSYENKVKVIYIDPPYNTNRNFIYRDNWQPDRTGGELRHKTWLDIMSPRLYLARTLMCSEGVIFISIGSGELANLKLLCDEIFGEDNFIDFFLWTKTLTPPSLSEKVRRTVEFILCYEKCRNKNPYFGSALENGDVPLINTGNTVRELCFPPGSVRFTNVESGRFVADKYKKAALLKDVFVRDGVNAGELVLRGEFKWSQKTVDNELVRGTYFLIKSDKFSIRFQRKSSENKYKAPRNLLEIESNTQVATNEAASRDLKRLGMEGVFDYPKPVSLLTKLIDMVTHDDKSGIVLDFFAGSSSTAEAVMRLNAADGGCREFIMAQMPEPLMEDNGGKVRLSVTKAIKFLDSIRKPYNIAEIGKERIRRAGEAILHELSQTGGGVPDVGFQVWKEDI